MKEVIQILEREEEPQRDFAVDLSSYDSSFSLRNKLGRMLWNLSYWILFRPFNLRFFDAWRAMVLRTFGAKIGKQVSIYASVKVWAPWNLEIGDFSSLGPEVDCYNQGKITIGSQTNISQKTYLCASTHDYTVPNFPLIRRPIKIENEVWIAADAFVGPGVHIGRGAVVAARAAVFRNIEPWTVVGGNPAEFLKARKMKQK